MALKQTTIYHCQHCGNVVYQEDDREAPKCCGQEMVGVVADFVWELNEQSLRRVPQDTREIIRAIHTEHRDLLRRLCGERDRWNKLDDPTPEAFAEMRAHLHDLREHLAAHFASEECGGYLSHVVAAAPRFEREVTKLSGEHVEFLSRLDALIDGLKAEEPETWKEARADFGQLVVDLRCHEGAETSLVQSAFSDDVGAGGCA